MSSLGSLSCVVNFDAVLAAVAASTPPVGEITADGASANGGGVQTFIVEQIPLITDYGIRVIGVIVLMLVAWILAGWAGRATRRGMTAAGIDETLTRFVAKTSRWCVLLLAVLACLQVFGVGLTSFTAVLAATGFAIGMGFQGSLSNIAAGVMLLVFRPFTVGDVVTAAGQTGKIEEIGLFTTTMDTPDNRRLIIPNSAVFGSVIENVTFHDVRRVAVDVGTDYGADLDTTRGVLEKAITAVPGQVSGRDPAVVLAGLGASSVDWSVRVWVPSDDFFSAKETLTRAIKVELDTADIGIPFPQMDVHVDGSTTAG